jgi:hypothetical protein
VLVVRETTSELEMHDFDHPVICWCRKQQPNKKKRANPEI